MGTYLIAFHDYAVLPAGTRVRVAGPTSAAHGRAGTVVGRDLLAAGWVFVSLDAPLCAGDVWLTEIREPVENLEVLS